MSIILRKVRGISGFTPLMRMNSGSVGSYGAGAAPGSILRALTSLPAIALVAIALLIAALVAWTQAHGGLSLVALAHAFTGPAIGGAKVMTANAAVAKIDDEMKTKQQTLHEVFEKAGEDIDFSRPDVLQLVGAKDSMEAVEKVRALNAELDDLGKKRDGAAEMERIKEETKSRRDKPARDLTFPNGKAREEREERKQRSLGRIIIESHAFKSYLKNRMPTDAVEDVDDVETKTAFTTSAGWAPQSVRVPGLVIEKATRPIQILDIIPTGPTAQAAVVYMEETTRTHSGAERAENATYAESAFALTQRSETVRVIGDSVPVTDEQLEDVPQTESYLNQRLTFGVNQRLDNQVINGDGNAPNLTGIVNKSGIQTQAKGSDPAPDAFFKAMTLVRVTGRAIPSAHIMHPTDWQNIRLLRTADGLYIWGSPAEAGPERMWGLMVAQADSLSAGTGIVGDFANFIQLWERSGIEIAVGYNSADFVNGRKTIRAGRRVALAIYRAAAFCTVTGL